MALYESGGDFDTYRIQLGYSNYLSFAKDLDALDGLVREEPSITITRMWESSLIKKTKYRTTEQQMIVTFVNDKVYQYDDITSVDYDSFCNAESQGSYFTKNIRNKKPTIEIKETLNESGITQN